MVNSMPPLFDAASVDFGMTQSGDPIIRRLRTMFADRPIGGNTHIDAGIDLAVNSLFGPGSREHANKTIILLTDGQQYPYSNAHIEAARRAAARNVTIRGIAFSKEAGFPDVQQISDIGGGKAFLARDAKTLREAFVAIARMSAVVLCE
jgi:Mg-chelatase subunit ChlD